MEHLDQLIVGILIGVAVLGVAVLAVWVLVMLREIVRRTGQAMLSLNRAVLAFEKSADMSRSLAELGGINRRLIVAVEAMTAGIQVFNGMVFQGQPQPGTGEDAAAPVYPPTDYDLPHSRAGAFGGMGWKPPVPSMMEQFADPSEADVLYQTDEELAGTEFAREAAERGEATETEILGRQSAADVREQV